MRKLLGATILFGTAITVIGALHAADADKPDWAYAIPPAPPAGAAPAPAAAPDTTVYTLPGTDKKFTANQIRGRVDNDPNARVSVADWFPEDHPTMPKLVSTGDASRNITACGLCHYPNGKGRSENAAPSGLPKEYIVEQMHDFRDGLRESAEPRKANTKQMAVFAKAMTEQEISEVADYFSSMKWTPWVKVVETKTVPKTRSAGGLYIPLTGDQAGMEPIGKRIIEVPDNSLYTETLRNPHSPFTAYVPVGAVAKGKALASTGGAGKTTQCAICHGEGLNGVGAIPGIAARSPTYIVRQLYDIKVGARKGGMTALMQPVVAKLSSEDMLNLAAYIASLPAPAQKPTFTNTAAN